MPDTAYNFTNTQFISAPTGPNQALLKTEVEAAVTAGTFSHALVRVDTIPGQVTIWFADALEESVEEPALTALVEAHTGETIAENLIRTVQISQRQADGAALVAIAGRIGKEVIYATHNFCDKTTWYSESERITQQTLIDIDGTGEIWNSPDDNWIDLTHGKVYDEEGLIEDQKILAADRGLEEHGYEVVVRKDGVVLNQCDPFGDMSTGDYCVDSSLGRIILAEPAPGSVIDASYSRANSSGWILQPLPGKSLQLEKSEIQFSVDINYNDAIVMEIFGSSDFFAPQLGLPSGTPIPLADPTIYKTVDQLVDEAISAFPPIPNISPGTTRGFSQQRHVFQFHYSSVRTLFASLGMFVRVSLQSDKAFGGERSTATFYCTSDEDPGPVIASSKLSG